MPKGEYETPGPFILRQNMGAHALFRRLSDEAIQYVGTLSNGLDEAERDELLGLLNKGTHFERLVEAAKRAVATLEASTLPYDDQLWATRLDELRDAIAEADS